MDVTISIRKADNTVLIDGVPWNEGATFIGVYHGIKHYARSGKIICLDGVVPAEFENIGQFQRAVKRWENGLEDDE